MYVRMDHTLEHSWGYLVGHEWVSIFAMQACIQRANVLPNMLTMQYVRVYCRLIGYPDAQIMRLHISPHIIGYLILFPDYGIRPTNVIQ